jgi:hypothetical protein
VIVLEGGGGSTRVFGAVWGEYVTAYEGVWGEYMIMELRNKDNTLEE